MDHVRAMHAAPAARCRGHFDDPRLPGVYAAPPPPPAGNWPARRRTHPHRPRGVPMLPRSLATAVTAALAACVLLAGCGEAPAPAGTPAASAGAGAAPPTEVVELVHVLPETLPEGLVFETNNSDPEFADPNAVRGGTLRSYMSSFPLTLRLVGPDSNSGLAGELRALQLGPVDFHPNTRKPIPVLATHWAFGADGRSVYLKLNPAARWSDGEPVTADDYLFTLRFMRSKAIVEPWYNDYYTNIIVDARKYDDHTIGILGNVPKPPDELLNDIAFRPTPEHFHVLNANWVRDYSWKVEPTTGAYRLDVVEKGKYVEFARVDGWWGDDQRYLRHRFNPERVRYDVIRDPEVALRHFLKGELDTFALVRPDLWHDKVKGEAVDKGYIHRIWFYVDVPQPAQGLWLNMDDPLLADRDIRYGLAHATNFQKVIDTLLRGDYDRQRTHYEGVGDYSNLDIVPRAFDLAKADAHFAAAGFGTRGPDGIRVRDGQRLALTINYGQPHLTDRLTVVQQDARQAGVDYQLQLMDAAASFKQVQEKKHQVAYVGWSGGGPISAPAYWEFYHSANAHKAQTNNIVNMDDPEMDALIDEYRASTDRARRVALAKQIEQRVHDAGALIPSWKVAYVREGYWRWMRMPPWHGTRSSSGGMFDPMGEGLFWIDEAEKARTLAARASGQAFEPVLIRDETWKVR
jgi:microcin C transport system substrate-binding protein